MKWALMSGLLAIGSAGVAWSHFHGDSDGEVVRVLATHEIKEKLDGHETSATIVEVTIAAGKEGLSHRHPGPVLVYVLEGTYELGLDDEPTKIFKAGETFYEPGGSLHRVSRNPSQDGVTRLIATVIHPRDEKEIATPAGASKEAH